MPNNHTTTESPHDSIFSIIKYYILLGFLSIFFYWIAWATWIIAGERQVRRIRFEILCIDEEIFLENDLFSYALFQNILRQEIAWFDVHSPGELTNHFVQNLGTIKNQPKYSVHFEYL